MGFLFVYIKPIIPHQQKVHPTHQKPIKKIWSTKREYEQQHNHSNPVHLSEKSDFTRGHLGHFMRNHCLCVCVHTSLSFPRGLNPWKQWWYILWGSPRAVCMCGSHGLVHYHMKGPICFPLVLKFTFLCQYNLQPAC